MFSEQIFTSVICSGFVNHKLKRIPEKFVTSAWYISVVSLSGCVGGYQYVLAQGVVIGLFLGVDGGWGHKAKENINTKISKFIDIANKAGTY